MPRGGYRPNAGRRPGSRNIATERLERALAATGEGDLLLAASKVFDDPSQDWRLRLDAARIAFGAVVGRVYAGSHVGDGHQ